MRVDDEVQVKAFRSGERVSLTASRIEKFTFPADAAPSVTQAFLWDSKDRQLAVRVMRTGAKTYIFQSTLQGKTIRMRIGSCETWGLTPARKEAKRLQAIIDEKNDPRDERKAKAAKIEAERERDELTVKVAFEDYLKRKIRKNDGLPLKQRTKDDYLGMLDGGRPKKAGGNTMPGMLHQVAHKPLSDLTGKEIRKLHEAALKRSERQAAYAMQALRAVLNWHGVHPEQNPFDTSLAGKYRIAITPSRPSKRPITQDRIGQFWIAVQGVANEQARDYFSFLLLSGCRVNEPKKIKVGDCDLRYGRVVIRDTKNRKDHTILLSRQLAEIVERRVAGKKAGAFLFDLSDGKRSQMAIIEELGEAFRPKDMRSTFATIASRLTTVYVLKRMMNHTDSAQDVTTTNYVLSGDEEVRAGWQAVADFIDEQARKAANSAGVVDMEVARQARAKEAS